MIYSIPELTWKKRKLWYINHFYRSHALKWENAPADDRSLFCVIYHKIIDAINSLPENPDNYVCVAMNRCINSDCATLDAIITHFEGPNGYSEAG